MVYLHLDKLWIPGKTKLLALNLYKQEQGTAIGAKFAPSYAILALDDFEKSAIDGFDLKPWVWWRYIDDVFFIWEHGEESLNEFLSYLNTLHPTIKFESPAQYSRETLDFLDVTLTRVRDRLKTDIFTKKTDTHQFLEFTSCHPFHTKRSIPYRVELIYRYEDSYCAIHMRKLKLCQHFS